MITFRLNPKTGCEIYRDGELIEVCTLADKNARLKALGHVSTAKPEFNGKRGAKNGAGWTRSTGMRRGV